MAQMMNYKKLGMRNRVLGVIGILFLMAVVVKVVMYLLN